MVKDVINYEGKCYQVSTMYIEGFYVTAIFPIENNNIVSGYEVYKFVTTNSETSRQQHINIVENPEKYVDSKSIKDYIEAKEDFKVSDLEKFKNFFDEMKISYEVKKTPNNTISLEINEKHIAYSYSNSIELIFDIKDNKFINFEAYGE